MLTYRRRSASRLLPLVFALVAGLTIVLGALLSTAQAAPVGALKQFRVPTDNSQPRYITEGIDGNLWFTKRFTPQGVGRLDPTTGVSRVFAVDGGPEEIAPAAGGSMWFTRTTAGNIARG